MSSSSFGVDFGPKVDLTATIRNILRNYPEGTAILKELVQNADDAGARTISFCLDKRQHGTKKLPSQTLQSFQGPSLLVYNDATFSKTDFESIQRIGDSLKKAEETQSKIGRFGIGFNSVYHMTDLPSFVSTQYVVLLDPQARYLPDVNPSNPGKMIDYISHPEVVAKYADQFAPFEAYHVDWKKVYNGTLFRLPLRTQEQARSSLLSKRALSSEEVEALLHSLQLEASAMLLFLKNIEVIEIKLWSSHDEKEGAVIFSCAIDNISRELRRQRSLVGESLNFTERKKSSESLKSHPSALVTADYGLRIKCTEMQSDSNSSSTNIHYFEEWDICNQLGGGDSSRIANDPVNALLRLIPWGGVAALVSTTRSDAEKYHRVAQAGLAYCFLPLPVSTGLPVMVNAFFELSSNRRDIWQAGQDMQGDGRTRALWNVSLLRDVISPSYVRLLLRLREPLDFSERYQNFWPAANLASPWDNVYEATLSRCHNERLVKRCISEQDSVITLNEDRDMKKKRKSFFGKFGKSDERNGDDCESTAISNQWIKCHQAVLLPDNSTTRLHEQDVDILVDVLLNKDQLIVVCLSSLWNILTLSKACETIATPSFIRDLIRTDDIHRKCNMYQPPIHYCRFLLSYCLSDKSLSNPEPSSDLTSLPVLPLANNSVGLLKILSEKECCAVSELTNMGFSVSQASFSLSRVDYDVLRACEFLTTCEPSDNVYDNRQLSSALLYIVCEEAEMRVFKQASEMLLNKSLVNSKEVECLSHSTMQKYSNVRLFSASLVPDLLRRILPPECFKGIPVRISELNDCEEVLEFLRGYWEFSKLRPDVIVATVEGAAIIPSRNGYLLPLSRISHCIVVERAESKISPDVVDILQSLQAFVVDEAMIPNVSSTMPHVFWDYIFSPVRQGVLTLLDSLHRSDTQSNTNLPGNNVFECLSADQRNQLLKYIAECEQVSTLSDKEIEIIRKLPLFQVANGAYYVPLGNGSSYKAIKDCSKLSTELFSADILSHDTPQLLQLYSMCGVSIISRSKYFKDFLLPNASELFKHLPDVVEQDLFEMMNGITLLMDEDRNFGNVLKDSAFVPNGIAGTDRSEDECGGESMIGERRLFKPSELFDPSVDELYTLLDPSFFPSKIFQRDDLLVHLRKVGLHSTLDWTGVITCAKSIEAMPGGTRPTANDINLKEEESKESLCLTPRQARGSCLFQYLIKNMSRLVGESKSTPKKRSASIFSLRGLFMSESVKEGNSSTVENCIDTLRRIAWVPVHQEPLDSFMPWPDCTSEKLTVDVATPLQSRPSSDAWYCSASCSLALLPAQVSVMTKSLGWDAQLPTQIIAKQLREIAMKYIEMKNRFNKTEENCDDLSSKLQKAREKLSALIPVLYQRLNGVGVDNTDMREVIISLLDASPWIWVGDDFVHPSRVAFSSPLNLTPYLYAIPQDLAVYSTLLNFFNVKEVFSARDYVSVLHRMAVDTHSIPLSKADKSKESAKQVPLSDSLIDMAVALVTLLSAEGGGVGDNGNFCASNHSIYVPDHSGKLAVATELVSDDVPWMNGTEYTSTRAGIRFCHPHISSKVANRIGVKSLRQILVDKSVESLFVDDGKSSLTSKGAVEAFGPSESLTGRLRTILDMYPDGNPIFSELIQNADDAGATVVRIMIDENSYPCESLMDSSVSALQGPALLFYNDATFKESDFRSLARIGQGSKLEKLSTTGRFGLGFNSVYHLTDTPSFVSGEHLVVFDPHTSYMPGTSAAQPGLRMKFCGNELSRSFPDQFKPYEHFDCSFEQSYPGTLFRFPFRNAAMARKSEISKRSYSISDINTLLSQLSSELGHYLIFLRSVRAIEIYRLSENNSEPVLLHRAQSTVSNLSTHNDQRLLRYFEQTTSVSSTQRNPSPNKSSPEILMKDNFYNELAASPDAKLPWRSYHLTVEVLNSKPVDDKVFCDENFIQDKKSDTSHSCIEYLIIMGLRGGGAKQLACNPKLRHLKLVPMGAVAACLRKTDLGYRTEIEMSDRKFDFQPLDGQAFCFLPLPVRTQLPLHINAYFELSSNRRDIWRGDDTTGESKVRGEWNDMLLKDVLAPLYEILLSRAVMYTAQCTSQDFPVSKLGNALLFTRDSDVSNEDFIISLRNRRRSHSILLSLLPSPPPPDPWNTLSSAVLPLLKCAEILWTNMNGGLFISLGSAIVMKEAGSKNIDSAQNNMQSNCGEILSDTVDSYRLEHLLLLEGLPIAVIPEAVYMSLIGFPKSIVQGEVSPEYVRSRFRIQGPLDNYSLSTRHKAHQKYMSRHPSLYFQENEKEAPVAIVENAAFLLNYCISDLLNRNHGNQGRDEIAPLCGLQLVPMEDGTLGLIGEPTETAPLFLASENERKLLHKVCQCLIAKDSVVGTKVAEYFKSSACSEVYNIRPLNALDTLKLLKEIVPEAWFSHSTVLVNRLINDAERSQSTEFDVEYVSVEWLQGLWGYVMENDCLQLFEGMIPMIPVVQPPFLPQGSYLLKLFPSIPVLHMSFKDYVEDAEAVAALGDIGLYIFDPEILGSIAYSKELSSILCDPSPMGLLRALCSVRGKIDQYTANWKPARRDSMRHLILDLILAKVEKVSEDEKEVLRSFPVYKRCSRGLEEQKYSALLTLKTKGDDLNPDQHQFTLKIPPRSVKENQFFDENFVSLRSSKDRDLYFMLGLTEPSGGSFYLSTVLPKVEQGMYSNDAMDKISVNLLVSLGVLEQQQPGLSQMLRNCKFVKSAGGAYCQPSELFDPHAPYLPSLMPSDAFPCSLLYEKEDIGTILASLRRIGLCTGLTPHGVLRAAEAIERDRHECQSSTEELTCSPSSQQKQLLEQAVQRSINLLRYLDLNFLDLMKLLGDATGSDDKAAEFNQETVTSIIEPSSSLNRKDKFFEQLRSIYWIAVHTRVPSSSCINSIAPPWPNSLHHLPLAKASQCVLLQDIWLCSTVCRVVQVEIHSDKLKEALGWGNMTIPGRIVTQQLLALWQLFQQSKNEITDATDSSIRRKAERQHNLVVDMCYSIVPKLMSVLSAALETESEVDVDIWCRALTSKPILWVSSAQNFVEPNRVAFTPLYGIDAEPSLFVAKGELLSFKPLLRRWGVKEAFDATDLSGLLQSLKCTYKEEALPVDKLEMCLGIVKIIVRLLNPPPADDDGNTSDNSDNSGVKMKKENIVSESLESVSVRKQAEVAALGKLFLPDYDAVMTDITLLSFDDAPWISSQLSVRSGGGGLRFVHKSIQPEAAQLLGAKSLREQLFAGDDIVCPTAASVNEIIRSDTISDALGDLVGLSDMVGAVATHLLFDSRFHPCESLMHPGLADCQGPALVLYMEGVVLGSEEIAQLLMSPALLYHLPTSFSAGVACPLNAASKPDDDENIKKEIKFNTYGKRLTAAFAITDCLQILSGCEYFIFDPCGSHLIANGPTPEESLKATGEKEAMSSKCHTRLPSKAQRCFITGRNNQDLLTRFPDQFSPLLNISFSLESGEKGKSAESLLSQSGQVNGTLIRMPLRFSDSSLSSNVFDSETLASTLNSLLRDGVSWLEGSLLFSRFVSRVTLHHWYKALNDVKKDSVKLVRECFSIQCMNASHIQDARKKITADKSWKKAGRSSVSNMISSLFSQAVNPMAEITMTSRVVLKRCIIVENAGIVERESVPKDHPWLIFEEKDSEHSNESVDETLSSWLITLLQGAPKARSLALKAPFKPLGILPYISIAAKIMSFNEIDTFLSEPSRRFHRYIYCGGGNLSGCLSGLPFHLDGSFVMNLNERGVIGVPVEVSSGEYMLSQRQSDKSQIISVSLLQQWNSSLLAACFDSLIPKTLLQLRDQLIEINEGEISPDLKRFYLFWPYLSNLSRELAFIALHQSNLHLQLSQAELFLGRRGFQILPDVVVPLSPCPPCMNTYLQSFIPFADVPSQITKDFARAKVRFDPLTPDRLRIELKRDSHVHCSRLHGRHEVVSAMLKFCLSDIIDDVTNDESSLSEYQQRRNFLVMEGCPLLSMANGQTCCFPRERVGSLRDGDPVYLASLSLHAIMNPAVRGALIHPTAFNDVPLALENSVFKDALQMKDVSTAFIHHFCDFFLPPSWQQCAAVEWAPTNTSGNSIDFSMSSDVGPSPLVIFNLWREILTISTIDELQSIARLPLLPVVVGSGSERRQLLVCASFAAVLINTATKLTAAEEESRLKCVRESGRLKSIVMRECDAVNQKIKKMNELDMVECYSTPINDVETECLCNEGNDESKNESDDLNNTASPLPPPPPPPNAHQSSQPPLPVASVDVYSSPQLAEAMSCVRMPQFDGSLLERAPKAIHETTERAIFLSGGPNSLGHKILNCLAAIHTAKVVIFKPSENQQLVETQSLLTFDKLNATHRRSILLEILNAHRSRPLSAAEILNLKSLPLFTNREGKVIQSISDITADIFWCESNAALAGLESTNDINATATLVVECPVVLMNDPELRALYQLVGAEELTPGMVVRRFTLPSLSHMRGSDRVRVMSSLSSQWENYRIDEDLVKLLKGVAFVPSWIVISEDGVNDEVVLDLAQYRTPSEMFSWRNDLLLETLQGSDIASYFVPPSMRTDAWHDMLSDLGMLSDLDKGSVIRIAKDIEESANDSSSVAGEKAADSNKNFPVRTAAERGRALLRYLRDDDRVFLFDASLCRSLRTVRFVPAEIPLKMDNAGFVVLKPIEVCRFDQLISAQKGHLGFTVMPILDGDISPPQSCYSSLGVTVVPTVQVVLRHIRNIITSGAASGDSLDRWNMDGKFTLRDTFHELFKYLADNWPKINPAVQNSLSSSAFVPVGHTLIKPGRLFFRLSEDLSPFMHEIPRYFGMHETFLKLLGVREKPSSSDYARFLEELASECRGVGLNPNELRAVLAIIQAIAHDRESKIDADSQHEPSLSGDNEIFNNLFVPDEDSVLRLSSACLFNDNGWLRERLPSTSSDPRDTLYVVHPFVDRANARYLGIPHLSHVLVEKLPYKFVIDESPHHEQLTEIYSKVLESYSFAAALSQIYSRTSADDKRLSTGTVEIFSAKLQKCHLVFAKTVSTVMEIRDPRRKNSQSRNMVSDAVESLCFIDTNSDGDSHRLIINTSMLLLNDLIDISDSKSSTNGTHFQPSVALGVGLARMLSFDPSLSATIALLIDNSSVNIPDKTQVLLSNLRISTDPASLREQVRGSPGTVVTDSDKKMLELKPFRVFRQGEIVAFDANYILRDFTFELNKTADDDISKKGLVYGKVLSVDDVNEGIMSASAVEINQKASTGEEYVGLKRILVRTCNPNSSQSSSASTATFLPTNLYSFKSARDVSLHKEVSSNFTKNTELPKKSEVVPSSSKLSSTSMQANSEQLSNEVISQEEIMGALGGLLYRAGIPMSMEAEDMMKRIIELEASKVSVESTLQSERAAFAESQSTIDQMKATMRCQICLTSSISHVLVSCGHTVCGDCLVQLQRNKCPFCRKAIEKRVKLFFSNDDGDN